MNPDRVRQKLGTFKRRRHERPPIIKLAMEHGWKVSVVPETTSTIRYVLTRGEQSCRLLIVDNFMWMEDPWMPAGPVTRDRPGVGVVRLGDDFLIWLTSDGPIDDKQAQAQKEYDEEVARCSF